MSITTRRGDDGDTELLFGRVVRKSDPRVAAIGAVDELNAALGVVRAGAGSLRVAVAIEGTGGRNAGEESRGGDREAGGLSLVEVIDRIQRDLIALMGELSVLPEDGPRYEASGMVSLDRGAVEFLDRLVEVFEAGGVPEGVRGWALPGAEGSHVAAYLDQARTICRRAEQGVWRLRDAGGGGVAGPPIGFGIAPVFLNRLSDVMWLLARAVGRTSSP